MKKTAMMPARWLRLALPWVVAVALLCGSDVFTKGRPADSVAYPNPYRTIENPLTFPPGREIGWICGLAIDRNGKDVWVADSCGGELDGCGKSTVDPVMHFDASGKFLNSFGGGLLANPHSIYVDASGNIWVADGFGAKPANVPGRGQQMLKFSPDGKLLMRLGTAGVKGKTENTFNMPSSVVVAPSGDIFVADGHVLNPGDPLTNQRVVKFSKDGKFILAWGTNGTAHGEFSETHTIAMDSQGRVFVGDRRNNNRIQIFDQGGKFLEEWKQFGSPALIFINRQDVMYVTDTVSDEKSNPGYRRGIYIGSAKDGRVTAFIPDTVEPNKQQKNIAVDSSGNVYGGYATGRMIRKYVKQ
jgi:hypothetical protein